ncbi:hypothetical protein chiPu_0019690 [Chiloscyllium punctatum]|uniref:Uncharacterized protein n=1 Tax=Chiloscyllium punctatum TaxID=137246 RepID=A0A401RSV3_CHIPU|nr:hypothetical protein [Chiloscyllium punctatum]
MRKVERERVREIDKEIIEECRVRKKVRARQRDRNAKIDVYKKGERRKEKQNELQGSGESRTVQIYRK